MLCDFNGFSLVIKTTSSTQEDVNELKEKKSLTFFRILYEFIIMKNRAQNC